MVHFIKGRHYLIMRGWTKVGTHACSSTSVFKTTIVILGQGRSKHLGTGPAVGVCA